MADGLYSIVKKAREDDFNRFGRNYDGNFVYRMESIARGEPLNVLSSNSCYRDMARIMLSDDKPVFIVGKDKRTNFAYVFDYKLDSEVTKRLNDLNRCGLTTFMTNITSTILTSWCFYGELYKASHGWSFVFNKDIRDAVRDMLKPFSGETAQYASPSKLSHRKAYK
jgi:hypothetical protein